MMLYEKIFLPLISENMDKPVAFFAHNVVDAKLDKPNKTIVFAIAETNEGSGYNTSTGIFTAPIGGLYQFIVSFCPPTGITSPLALVMSGNVIARSTIYNEGHPTCSSFPTVIRMKSGEKVWVKSLVFARYNALQENSRYMNSFSGMLINK